MSKGSISKKKNPTPEKGIRKKRGGRRRRSFDLILFSSDFIIWKDRWLKPLNVLLRQRSVASKECDIIDKCCSFFYTCHPV
jgi:hypothetical protein